MAEDEILLIHLGGLGDVVLSESVFHSLSLHFGARMAALGNRRFLALFPDYFHTVHSIDSPRWLFLFADRPEERVWEQVIFVGKDRHGSLREQWRRLSGKPLLFIDMYPPGAFDPDPGGQAGCGPPSAIPAIMPHIEDYQLAQLPAYSVAPIRKDPVLRPAGRVILYPEEGYSKRKWPVQFFLALHEALRSRGVPVLFLEGPGLSMAAGEKVRLEELAEVKAFFADGGLFVSNDSGMAHLAGACGLRTITIFTDSDPSVWHPRGENLSFTSKGGGPGVPEVERAILSILAGLNDPLA